MPLQIFFLDYSIFGFLVDLTIKLPIWHVIHCQFILQAMLDVLQLIFELNRQGCICLELPSQGSL